MESKILSLRTVSQAAILVSLVLCGAAGAADGHVRITQPATGATLDALEQIELVYEVSSGVGDHVHVYVDDQEVGILRQLKGSYTLESLAPGKHDICIKVVNKAHTPIGLQDCIVATVE